jgi:Macrocin-O-methyltransferase (TylF)
MHDKGGAFLKTLSAIGRCLPGERFKTSVYLNCIAGPRKALRQAATGFYRMDHIYDVLREFGDNYAGRFSILEFGVADGYSFTKMLYATEYMDMTDRVVVHGFDTFAGLPECQDAADESLIGGEEWVPGTYVGRYDDLRAYCARRYPNHELHKGLFEHTLTDRFLSSLEDHAPILIWIDCDYYASTRQIFDRLIPYIPTGCVVYFDDLPFNYGSRFTGEMRAVTEINDGSFGDGVELVRDRNLSWNSDRIYRFINLHARTRHRLKQQPDGDPVRYRRDDSPFP